MESSAAASIHKPTSGGVYRVDASERAIRSVRRTYLSTDRTEVRVAYDRVAATVRQYKYSLGKHGLRVKPHLCTSPQEKEG